MTDKQCDKYIQKSFEEKKSKAQPRSLSDSDDDKENSMQKHLINCWIQMDLLTSRMFVLIQQQNSECIT
jgi:hypothetical protein